MLRPKPGGMQHSFISTKLCHNASRSSSASRMSASNTSDHGYTMHSSKRRCSHTAATRRERRAARTWSCFLLVDGILIYYVFVILISCNFACLGDTTPAATIPKPRAKLEKIITPVLCCFSNLVLALIVPLLQRITLRWAPPQHQPSILTSQHGAQILCSEGDA